MKPWEYEVGDIVPVGGINYKIIDRRIEWKPFNCKDGRKGFRQKQYLCECPKCHNSLWKSEAYLKDYRDDNGKYKLSGIGCKYCTGKKVKVGFNNVGFTHPWIRDLLVNPEDADKVTAASREKFWFKCPICGAKKRTGMCYVVEAGRVTCNKCSDNVSYPNKFAYSVLMQSDVEDLESEYHKKWCKRYRYDFSFFVKGVHYLLQMDGEQHFKECGWRKLEKQQATDKEKDKLAAENGCVLIRIPCEYGKEKYIRQEMENSLLSQLIDFSKIDWGKVKMDCAKNELKEACDYYNKHHGTTPSQMAKHFHRCSCTMREYLKRGTKLGICNYQTVYEIADERREQIYKIKNAHPEWIYQQIADEMGGIITGGEVQHVLNVARKNNDTRVDFRTSCEVKRDTVKQLVLDNPDMTDYAISQKFGYSREFVTKCRMQVINE